MLAQDNMKSTLTKVIVIKIYSINKVKSQGRLQFLDHLLVQRKDINTLMIIRHQDNNHQEGTNTPSRN